MAKLKDLTGQIFGRWTVSSRSNNDINGQAHWLCRCDCGVEARVNGTNLRTGKSVSCGCFKDESVSARSKTHGLTQSRTYRIWANMLSRTNQKHIRAVDYADRGIGVCESWKKFDQFLADMGECPSDQHSIDRINNDLGYSQENCRWATQIEQANNTRANNTVSLNGDTKSLAQWSRETGINYSTLRNRVNRSKMAADDALHQGHFKPILRKSGERPVPVEAGCQHLR